MAFLERLKHPGPMPKTKAEASTLIDHILVVHKDKKERKKNPRAGSQHEKEWQRQHDRAQKAWIRECRQDVRAQIREDQQGQRQLQRDLRRCGSLNREDLFAGWLVHIGPHCDAKELDGLLITVEDGEQDLDFFPPYDGCKYETCECEVEPVTVGEVPKGTRIAERVAAELNTKPQDSSVKTRRVIADAQTARRRRARTAKKQDDTWATAVAIIILVVFCFVLWKFLF